MKKVLLISLLIIFAIAVVYFGFIRKPGHSFHTDKPQPLAVSKHSTEFNQSVQKMMSKYYDMTEGFVNWDTTAINKNAISLRSAMDSIKLDEIKKDSAIYETAVHIFNDSRSEVNGLIADTSLLEKKQSLNLLSNELLQFLNTVKFDMAKVYFNECPMAFDQGNPVGNWLSAGEQIRNPYLGLHHPKYKGAMIECGEIKVTINFIAPDSGKK